MQAIIQVEYFHVDMEHSFDTVFEEMHERVRDALEAVSCGFDPLSSGIKTTLRFYDQDGSIADLITKLKILENQWFEGIKTTEPDLVSLYIIRFKSFRRVFQKRRLEHMLYKSALNQIRLALVSQDGVSGQMANFSFRYIHGDEKHELLQSISVSKRALWFVLKPDSLLSEETEVQVCYLD
jgi:hypothetical protein